jgi:DNA-binding MarR family transcriptional regulator
MGANSSPRRRRTSTPKAEQDVRRILDAMRIIVRQLRLSASSAERQLGISGAQLFVLEELSRDDPASINDLARRTHTDQSSVSTVVSRLLDQKLVTRTPSTEDARRVEVRLTPKGRTLLRRALPTAQQDLIRALSELPASDRVRLAKALTSVVGSMAAGGEAAPMFFEDLGRKKRG